MRVLITAEMSQYVTLLRKVLLADVMTQASTSMVPVRDAWLVHGIEDDGTGAARSKVKPNDARVRRDHIGDCAVISAVLLPICYAIKSM